MHLSRAVPLEVLGELLLIEFEPYPDYSPESLWEESSFSSVGSCGHEVSLLEAHLYYFGIRGQTPGSQVDHPDIQGCLHSALGARTRCSSHAASVSI